MSGGPPRGVWGQRANGSPAPAVSLTWLESRINKVGLDGQICVEYISSLIELHKSSSSSDREAAICDFLHDSVHASSSLKGIAEQNRFVDETLVEIRSRLSGNQNASPTVAVPPAKAPFKKGVKLTGTALKQVVGNVKPSYVQQYSDDEREVSAPPPPPPPPRFVSAESLETPVRQSSGSVRRMNRAKEIGPDEDWDDAVRTVWKTPFESAQKEAVTRLDISESVKKPAPQPKPALRMETVVVESVVLEPVPVESEKESRIATPVPDSKPTNIEVALEQEENTEDSTVDSAVIKSVLLSPESVLYSLPTDILSFDFKFEEDEEVEPAPSFDLLKQMFEAPVTVVSPAVPEEAPGLEVPRAKNVYSVPFLLSVLNDMKNANGGLLPVPEKLRGLSRTEVSPPRPRSDSFGWRTTQPQQEDNGGSWRASGYNHKVTKRAPVPEQGFW